MIMITTEKKFVILIFLVVGVLIYSSSINSSFHLDDFGNIIFNPDVTVKELSYTSLKKAALERRAGLRPVPYLTFALNYYLSTTDTTSYHAVNIIIHVINAYLIYLIILSLLGDGSADEDERARISLSAFFTAIIWLVTPMNSQAVIYIVQRMTLLMTLFFLLSFYTYLLFRERKKVIYLILCGLSFALSILSKQNGVIFPAVVILYEFVFDKKGSLRELGKKDIIVTLSLVSILIMQLFIFRADIHRIFLEGGRTWGLTMSERLLTQPRVLVFYLSLIVLPLPGRLSIAHDFLKSTSLFSPLSTFFSIIFLIALFVFAISMIKKSHYLSFAIFWFFALSLIEAVIPIELAYEHRIYLPGIFLIGVLVNFVIDRFYVRKKVVVISFLCGVTFLFGILTAVRGAVWKDEITLWKDVVEKYPADGQAYYCIGFGYDQIKDFNNAEIYYKKAIENSATLRKTYLNSLNNLGAVYLNVEKYEEAEATLKELCDIFPQNRLGHYNLAQSLSRQKKYEEAEKEYQLAIRNGFRVPDAYTNYIYNQIMLGDVESVERIYNENKSLFDSICYGNYVKHVIFKSKDETDKADKYNKLYLDCYKKRGESLRYYDLAEKNK